MEIWQPILLFPHRNENELDNEGGNTQYRHHQAHLSGTEFHSAFGFGAGDKEGEDLFKDDVGKAVDAIGNDRVGAKLWHPEKAVE